MFYYFFPVGAFVGGILSGALCFAGSQIKYYFGFDDALDTFAIHYFGGLIGIIVVAFFAKDYGSNICDGIFYSKDDCGSLLLGYQLLGICIITAWSVFFTYVILKITDYAIGLRVSEDAEEKGLDLAIHDESLVSKSKIETFGKYAQLSKGLEQNNQTKYEKYQNMIGKYLS